MNEYGTEPDRSFCLHSRQPYSSAFTRVAIRTAQCWVLLRIALVMCKLATKVIGNSNSKALRISHYLLCLLVLFLILGCVRISTQWSCPLSVPRIITTKICLLISVFLPFFLFFFFLFASLFFIFIFKN